MLDTRGVGFSHLYPLHLVRNLNMESESYQDVMTENEIIQRQDKS